MAMSVPLSDAERRKIVTLLEAGKSHAEIARAVSRSLGSVANVAKAAGHTGDQSAALRTRKAVEGRSAYCAERRAGLAARATERAEEMLEEMSGEYLAYNFGGKDNTYAEHELDAPPIEAKRAMAQTFRDLMRTVIEIDRHDNRADEGVAAVDQWLRAMIGEAVT